MQVKERSTAPVVGLAGDRCRAAASSHPPVVKLSARPAATATSAHPVFGRACPECNPDSAYEQGSSPLRLVPDLDAAGVDAAGDVEQPGGDGQDGSLVTEYGLLAIVAATVAGVVIQWASGGAIVRLFNALLNAARDLVGAG